MSESLPEHYVKLIKSDSFVKSVKAGCACFLFETLSWRDKVELTYGILSM